MKFADYLNEHISKEMVSFHMPGHKGRGIFDIHGMRESIDNLVAGDITEIPGSDNLSQPQGIIRNTMDRYKALYGSEETFLSVGGSTLGIMASILATCGRSVGDAAGVSAGADGCGDHIGVAIARNSHKSVFNGVQLAGAKPVYIYPELSASGIAGAITPRAVEEAFVRSEREELKVAAVVIPSPNYYGVCSDIISIAEIAHKHGAVLIVDQAHGAHLRFLEPRLSADMCAIADIVIESTHKTLASFTQTAIINIYNKDLVKAIEESIMLLRTTSPSYILMKSLDINAELIEKYGEDLFESWRLNLDKTYAALDELDIQYYVDEMNDRSKILINMSTYGLTGAALSKELYDRGIVTELDSGAYTMCMTGIGNSKVDYERLIAALADIKADRTSVSEKSAAASAAVENTSAASAEYRNESNSDEAGGLFNLVNKEREMRDIPVNSRRVPASDAIGLVCAESIIPYPPGVPLIAAGEVMDEESLNWAIDFINNGGKVLGMDERGFVKAGRR